MPAVGVAARPGVNTRRLEIQDVEPLRAEIEAFLRAAREDQPAPVSGEDGRRALALALRALERIREHAEHPNLSAFSRMMP
jgi:predicted dehydrogenase